MQDWFNTTVQNVQSGDIGTIIMILLGILIFFFVAKILMNTIKAILIVVAVIVIASFLMPEVGIIEKATEITKSTADFVTDTIDEKISK